MNADERIDGLISIINIDSKLHDFMLWCSNESPAFYSWIESNKVSCYSFSNTRNQSLRMWTILNSRYKTKSQGPEKFIMTSWKCKFVVITTFPIYPRMFAAFTWKLHVHHPLPSPANYGHNLAESATTSYNHRGNHWGNVGSIYVHRQMCVDISK